MKRWAKCGVRFGVLLAVAMAVTMASRAWGQTPSASGDTRNVAAPDRITSLQDRYRTPLSLGTKLDIAMGKHEPASPETVAKIRACIEGLVEIDRAGYSYSPTISASLPMPEQTYAQAMSLTDPKQKAAGGLKALVEWGPDALPYLLKALDDKRPTKIVARRFGRSGPGPAGRMWFSNELEGNPMNPAEARALEGLQVRRNDTLVEYTLRVGDVCFVALGAIVGRPYAAMRNGQYDTTLTSPVEDADLCRRVRAAWSGEDPRKVVWDSLLTDYATEAGFNGKSLDGWGRGNDYQIAAALRMLYYFPAETGASIAARLDKLDVSSFQGVNAMIAREVTNGVRAEDLIKAIRHSPAQGIRPAVVGIFERAEDLDILLAAAPVMEDKAVVRDRLAAFAKTISSDGALGASRMSTLLYGAATMLGDEALPMMEDFLKRGGVEEAHRVAEALEHVNSARGDALLLRLLEDQRRVKPNWLRVCDMAAASLSTHHREFQYSTTKDTEVADRQIAAMKAALQEKR